MKLAALAAKEGSDAMDGASDSDVYGLAQKVGFQEKPGKQMGGKGHKVSSW